MIDLKSITKTFQIRNHPYQALKHINLHIDRGQIFGVLGKSGAGKSTLLRCVNLLERPTSGEVFVNGVNLTALSVSALRAERRKIGFIFQHFNLLESRTVFANVALPLEINHVSASEIQTKVDRLLELVGIADKKHYMPTQLSGGQKQRVAIARALATDPHILLCDEATSALDSESTTSILNLLQLINREFGLTILLISHELDVIKRICNRVGVMDHGELIEIGSTLEVLSNPQTTMAKQLVQQALHLNDWQQSKTDVLLLKLTFIGKDSDKPLISTLAKKFNVTVNILQALIERIQDTTVGFTICEMSGDQQELNSAMQYIHTTSIKAEVLSHA